MKELVHYDSFVTHKVNGEKYRYDVIARDHGEAIKFVLKQFTDPKYPVISSLDEITAIGHRVVHGGEKFKESVIVNEDVKKGIMRMPSYLLHYTILLICKE